MIKTWKNCVFMACAAVIIALAFTACPDPTVPAPPKETGTGSVSGFAVFNNSGDNSGIAITLEESDGLRAISVVKANRSIANGDTSGARSIAAARSVTGATKTAANGSFTLNNIPAGSYTLYASSPDSLEKAVAANVTVTANEVFDAGTLKLTPVGSITGKINITGGNPGDNMGFLVSVAGTSYMAITDANGNFTISGVPAGSGYSLIVMKGSYTALYSDMPISVSGGINSVAVLTVAAADLKTVSNVEIGANGNWWIDGKDTGVKAQGEKGEPGASGTPGSAISIGANGNWFIDGVDTGIPIGRIVTFDYNYNGGPASISRTVMRGSSLGIFMPTDPVRDSYYFDGWYNTPAETGGEGFYSGTTVTNDITVYARWLPLVTVTFNYNYGGAPAAYTVQIPSGYSVPANQWPSEPVRDSYYFAGWFQYETGSGEKYSSARTWVASQTIYAGWKDTKSGSASYKIGYNYVGDLFWDPGNPLSGGATPVLDPAGLILGQPAGSFARIYIYNQSGANRNGWGIGTFGGANVIGKAGTDFYWDILLSNVNYAVGQPGVISVIMYNDCVIYGVEIFAKGPDLEYDTVNMTLGAEYDVDGNGTDFARPISATDLATIEAARVGSFLRITADTTDYHPDQTNITGWGIGNISTQVGNGGVSLNAKGRGEYTYDIDLWDIWKFIGALDDQNPPHLVDAPEELFVNYWDGVTVNVNFQLYAIR